MARLWQSGFELNTTTTSVEFGTQSGSPSIQSSIARSGTYAGRITSLSSGTAKYFGYTFGTVAAPIFFRFYIRVDTRPSAANRIITIWTSGASQLVWISLNSDGTLQLSDEDGAIGSPSATIPLTDFENYIELKIDSSGVGSVDVVEARLNGSVFATSSTRALSAAPNFMRIGGNIASEAQTQGDWYFDDIAINDANGSFQTSYPGPGKVIHLRPSATGDSNGFLTQIGGTAGAANNFSRVSEVTPDDATSYNASALLSAEDLFNCDNSGLSNSPTINVVAVGVRMADLVGADATASFKLEIEKTTGGTKAQSVSIIPNSATWQTNANATPRNYRLVTYQDPDASNWTSTTLDSMQIGYIQDATNVQAIAITNIWASVDYVPGIGSTTIKDIIGGGLVPFNR